MAKRMLTKFIFYYNTPFTDYQNTVHFNSNKERDDYFLKGKHFVQYDYEKPFNFIRDRQEVNVNMTWELAQGINYLTFISDYEDRRYYAFVNKVEYVNDRVVKIMFVIDTIMTFTQGDILEKSLINVNIERQHLPKKEYEYALPYLRNNDDVIKASNKTYVLNRLQQFGNDLVMFQSSADLTKKFGTKKEPNLDTSKGIMYDNITSPVNLYIMSYSDFNNFMDKMSSYPWITQNFQKVQLIPENFIDKNDLEDVKTSEDVKGLKTLKSGSHSKNWSLPDLDISYNDLLGLQTIKQAEMRHLVRNEYMTIECYNWNGDSLLLDAGKLDSSTGLKFKTRSIVGYHNEVRIYPVNYNKGFLEQPVKSTDGSILIDNGSFLNTAITFNSFAEVPILIDNGILAQSQQANRQKNAESQLITNRIENIANGNDVKSRFYDAVSVASNLSPTALFSKFNDEYNFYKQQQAEYKDLALQPPTTTSSEMGNGFQIANSINGLTLKIGVPSLMDMQNITKYYFMFGFQTNEVASTIQPINSMTVCNYLKVDGTYTLNGVDTMLVEQLKAILASGVRFWHNDNSNNPMAQSVYDNKFRG